MPYGYEKHRLKNDISKNTIVHEVNLIRNMLKFINKFYKKDVAPHEIKQSDIIKFLDSERESGNKDSTINRKIGHIKNWFDYMWQSNQITYDFMPKFDYFERRNLKIEPSKIKINYNELLKEKRKFLNDTNITLVAKLLFIFYMRGLRVRDIVLLKVNQFEDFGDKLILQPNVKNDFKIIFEDPIEIGILLDGIERAIFRGVPFLFSSKVGDSYGEFQPGSLNYYLDVLAKYFGYPIRSEEIRYAYVYYLFAVKKNKIEDISKILGITIEHAARILKDSHRLEMANVI